MASLLVVILCLFINMILSGAEMAFVTVSRQQLKSLASKNKSARLLLKLKESPERTLSVIQIGISLVGAIAAAVGGSGAEKAFGPYLMRTLSLTAPSAEALAIILVVLPITYFTVVVGELVPKTIALRNPLLIALMAAKGLYVSDKILSPAVTILEKSTHIFVRLLGLNRGKTATQAHADFFIEDLPTQTKQYVVNLVSMDKKAARDIMLPWADVIFIRKEDSLADVENTIINSRLTRLPVLDGNDVIGMLHTKEFLAALRFDNNDWHNLIRPVLRFKSFEPIFKILIKMQEQKSHVAIIYDRLDFVGIVAMEDIFEEIIGEIFDEDDDELLKKILSSKSRRRPLMS